MSEAAPPHVPVLLAEVLDALQPREGGLIVDGAFGAGGYAQALLDRGAEIENDADVVGAEVRRHFVLGLVVRIGMPGGALLGELFGRLQHIAAPGAPVRVHIDDFHCHPIPR